MTRLPTKFSTLCYLRPIVTLFVIPELISFDVFSFKNNQLIVCKNVDSKFQGKVIAVRSSASDEDGENNSSAGEYDSVLNVPANSTKKVIKAINTVISSYERKRPLLHKDEVIVQEMVQEVIMSGVIFTHDLNTGAPYYVINYDDQSGLTDTVTSGVCEYANRTLYIHRNSIDKLHSERFKKLLAAVQELEKIMESKFLDIEFALGKDSTIYLLQVRSITTQTNWNRAISKQIDASLQGVQSFVTERFKKLHGVYGQTTVFGQMSDWNPVEMIGRAPRALATSLYQTLITDCAWRDARSIMGYAVPTGQPLMVTLSGQPFIDIRLSFHSYLPNGISSIIAEKLVNHWVEQLKTSPELHDKIEFEIAITTYSFDINEKIEKLIGDVLSTSEKEEFKRAHLKQTIQLISDKEDKGSIDKSLDKIQALKNKQERLNYSGCQDNSLSLFEMVDDCINLGTVPFSILARHGFIAKTILLSLGHQNIITYEDISQIQENFQTVASELADDMRLLQLGSLSNNDFMRKYGHLRPGTYDIRSHRYDQMGNFSSSEAISHKVQPVEKFKFTEVQYEKINNLLVKNGFSNFTANDLLDYIHDAIIGREYGKFIFTRTISDMLELIAKFAEKNGLSRDEISHVPLTSIFSMVKNSDINSIEEQLRSISEEEAEKHDVSVAIRLPQLLIDQSGAYVIPFQVSHPNFITHKNIIAQCIVLRSDADLIVLEGKIVIIEGADPGFDWIFSQKIAGLVTKYGGVNSHMAIRCAEFGIPAAIGCGEQRFDLLLKSNQIQIDCAAGIVNPL
jgi:phosphohistidine swiveling domain-containing protein